MRISDEHRNVANDNAGKVEETRHSFRNKLSQAVFETFTGPSQDFPVDCPCTRFYTRILRQNLVEYNLDPSGINRHPLTTSVSSIRHLPRLNQPLNLCKVNMSEHIYDIQNVYEDLDCVVEELDAFEGIDFRSDEETDELGEKTASE